jgi:hypothetical protein
MIGTRIGFLFIVREAEWDFRCAKMTRWGGFVGMETAVAPTKNQRHQIHRSRFCYVCGVAGGTAVFTLALFKHPNVTCTNKVG